MAVSSSPRRGLVVLGLAIALLLAACGTDDDSGSGATTTTVPDGGTVTLVGGWVLESYAGPSGDTPAAPGAAATMKFVDDGSFSATTGCNVLGGSYTTSGDELTITPGPMTLRACADPAPEAQEAALVAGLPLVTAFAVTGEQLELRDADGAALFTFAAQSDDLAGTSWVVTGVNNGQEALVGTPGTPELTLAFGADGTISGNGGCNSFSGTYTTADDTITVANDLATTLIGCEPAVSELEAQYLAALVASTTFEVSGTTLTLRDADGAMQVTATAA
ncbi:MAG: META domain-containing protein [Acidimicrobiales bacterium]|jgi:heat shock protein HslJ|nr:META domain-containing protein [Acidimicrobiales bacterium]